MPESTLPSSDVIRVAFDVEEEAAEGEMLIDVDIDAANKAELVETASNCVSETICVVDNVEMACAREVEEEEAEGEMLIDVDVDVDAANKAELVETASNCVSETICVVDNIEVACAREVEEKEEEEMLVDIDIDAEAEVVETASNCVSETISVDNVEVTTIDCVVSVERENTVVPLVERVCGVLAEKESIGVGVTMIVDELGCETSVEREDIVEVGNGGTIVVSCVEKVDEGLGDDSVEDRGMVEVENKVLLVWLCTDITGMVVNTNAGVDSDVAEISDGSSNDITDVVTTIDRLGLGVADNSGDCNDVERGISRKTVVTDGISATLLPPPEPLPLPTAPTPADSQYNRHLI